MKVKVISLLCLFCTFSQAFVINGNGICRNEREDGTSDNFCCDFFQQTENGCVACKDGFESFNGSMCKPCLNNRYGKQCTDRCGCITNQRCDHIIGCVDFTTTVDLYQGYSMVQRSVTDKESSNDKPKNDTEFKPILIYIVAAGSFTIIFTSIVFVISRRRKHQTNSNRIQRENESADLQRENDQIEQYSTIL